MARILTVKIDVTKINKDKLFVGKPKADGSTPKYLDLVLMETPDDKYGNDFRVVQSVSKEERAAGVKGAILGNAKWIGNASAPRQESKPEDDGDSSVPF